MTPNDLTIQLEPRECPLCGGHDHHLLFSDVNRREALPVSCDLVECNACTMRYLNSVPDSSSLRHLYGEGLVDPVDAGDSRMLQRLSLWNYPGETLAQWAGLGEEIIATGRNA